MIAVLMVTCCLEPSRLDVLKQVVANMQQQASPEALSQIVVIDNASTEPETLETLKCFGSVYRTSHNVGYWSAVSWWLDAWAQQTHQPDYTYIIESDMVHYNLAVLTDCATFLDKHPELGAMRLHEYQVENWRLYNKESPRPESRRNLWQSHTNQVTNQPVRHELIEEPFWKTNFLTQLPALNRFPTMCHAFDVLKKLDRFTEHNFQKLYHDQYPEISIINGGIFNCDLNPYGSKVVTGSWTSDSDLKRLGYQNTRRANIVPKDQYTVTRVSYDI